MRYGLKFDPDAGHDFKKLIKLLSGQYQIKKGRDRFTRIIFYDTFDWRLFNKSLVLYESGKKLYLHEISRNESFFSLQITSMPVFIRQFPESKLKEQLASIIETRALLRLVELRSRSASYSILNQDEKTVLRLVQEEIRHSRKKNAPALSTHLLIKPVKGYPEYARKIAKQLEDSGIAAGIEDEIFYKGMEAAGKKPGSYSTKLDIKLDPAMSSEDAAKVILRFLLRIMLINSHEIEKDIDTEFVHDFRVAVRRTRSALGQIKNVFPTGATERFKKDFSFVGKLSNELRDLDVYLLREDAYRAKLPPDLREDISLMFDYLRRKRENAFKIFTQNLKSRRYKKILTDWEAFLEKSHRDTATASNAAVPIIDLARKGIFKKFKNVVKTGNIILESSDDRMLHVLRVHCKKLRYLIEFFSSLFPDEKLDKVIKLLKKLQDNLGDFNDLRIQGEYLLEISRELPKTLKNTNKTLVAIGGLIGALGREREIIKDEFSKSFIDFASPENRDLFRELFKPKYPGALGDNTGNLQQ